MKHVWEDYGFSPSSATLSNHVSELRKAFEALGGQQRHSDYGAANRL
ncbi:hypothetical protein [Serratia fonticola]